MVMLRDFQILKPTSVEEAAALRARHGPEARFIAGGTDLLIAMRAGKLKPAVLIDLGGLPGLSEVHAIDGELAIGALTSLRTLERSAVIREKAPILIEAARTVAGPSLRSMATIGGNLCNASPAADLAVALLALDAEAVIVGPSARRTVPLADFFIHVNRTALGPDELLETVWIPTLPPRSGTAFLKLGRTAVDIALVNAAARVSLSGDGVCQEVRICLGAVAPTPIRARQAEAILIGQHPDAGLLQRASEKASEETSPITDIRATAAYRKHISKVLVKRVLESAIVAARQAGSNNGSM